MTRFYLDASFLVCLFVRQRKTGLAVAWLTDHAPSMIVSDFAGAEYASAISRLYRNRELDREAAASALDDFDDWLARATTRRFTSPADIAACERLVRRFELKLQAPDALHIAIALADEATLVTFDERQAEAMKQLGDCVVPA
jgi:predicted nucleic acid-binding protein